MESLTVSLLLDNLTADAAQSSPLAKAQPPARPRAQKKFTHERIAVIGLGYVGLPLAVCLSRKFDTVVGLDISAKRVRQLQSGRDRTNEVKSGRSCPLGP